MGLIAMNCPQCNAALELEDGRDKWFCQYCGAQVAIEKQHIELSGKVSVDGTATAASLLERAFMFLEDGNYSEADAYCEKVLDQDPKNAKAYLGKLMAELQVKKKEALKDCAEPFDNSNNFQKTVRFDEQLAKELKSFVEYVKNRNEKTRINELYQQAKAEMEIADTQAEYKRVADLFLSIKNFNDAESKYEQCLELAETARLRDEKRANEERTAKKRKKRKAILASCISITVVLMFAAVALLVEKVFIPNKQYNEAVDLMNKGAYEMAITAFEALNGHKDSLNQIEVCQLAIEDAKYQAAIDLMDSGNYEAAIAAFKTQNGYKDSLNQIEACQTAIKDANYQAAVDLMDNGDYEAAISAFTVLNGHKDSIDQIETCQLAIKDIEYQTAIDLMDNGAYQAAISAFKEMEGYKDSTEKAKECTFFVQKDSLKNIAVGNKVRFGVYEQDGNELNGQEEIEWKVLAVEGNKALIVSKNAIECKIFNAAFADMGWENSIIRTWLNKTFLNSAFSEKHQAMIDVTNVTVDGNPEYITSPGKPTVDKVFILSITEVKRYFSSDEERKCVPTEYAVKNGALISEGEKKGAKATCWWWLRTPGGYVYGAARVGDDGAVDCKGDLAFNEGSCVRPAMWISLEE